MRGIAGLLVGCALLFGVYEYYFKKMPTTDQGTAPTQAISLTGVREDLVLIAHAEMGYISQNGHCASASELVSSDAISMSQTERDGYAYSVECSGGEFTVTARHPAPAPGSPIRYPTLTMDQSMQIRDIN